MVVNKLFKILLASFYAVEKKLPRGKDCSYATRISVTHLATTDTVDDENSESLNLMADQITAVTIRQPQPSYWSELFCSG